MLPLFLFALIATNPFPNLLYGGSSYQAIYTDTVDLPYTLTDETNFDCDTANLTLNNETCNCTNSTFNCMGNAMPANLNLSLVSNIKPDNYTQTITITGNRTTPDYHNAGGNAGYSISIPIPSITPTEIPSVTPTTTPEPTPQSQLPTPWPVIGTTPTPTIEPTSTPEPSPSTTPSSTPEPTPQPITQQITSFINQINETINNIWNWLTHLL